MVQRDEFEKMACQIERQKIMWETCQPRRTGKLHEHTQPHTQTHR